MSKHTPGPWTMWTSCSYRRISSAASGRDGDVLHAVVQRADGQPDLHFPNGGFNGPDAILMLAAPDLLEALQALVTERDGHFHTAQAWDAARAAIAKATGQAA